MVVGGQLLGQPLVEMQREVIIAVAHVACGWISEHMTGCHQIVVDAKSGAGKLPLVAHLPEDGHHIGVIYIVVHRICVFKKQKSANLMPKTWVPGDATCGA